MHLEELGVELVHIFFPSGNRVRGKIDVPGVRSRGERFRKLS